MTKFLYGASTGTGHRPDLRDLIDVSPVGAIGDPLGAPDRAQKVFAGIGAPPVPGCNPARHFPVGRLCYDDHRRDHRDLPASPARLGDRYRLAWLRDAELTVLPRIDTN